MKDWNKLYENCTLCPKECHVNRLQGELGFCGQQAELKIARAALHFWEEEPISGQSGSGAVFFSGCTLRCLYCQNHEISALGKGYVISEQELCDTFLRLQGEGALNINLVTATMHVPKVAAALLAAKEKGLTIPIVYNSSGYEKVDTLRLLEGLVDVYLPDFKYVSSSLGGELSNATDYPKVARNAIAEMVRQSGPVIMENGLIKKGTIVRHLCLPLHVKEACAVIKELYDTYGNDIYFSIMSQYTPLPDLLDYGPHSELSRKITKREYERVLNYAISLGIENAYMQDMEVAKESFIPAFSDTPEENQ